MKEERERKSKEGKKDGGSMRRMNEGRKREKRTKERKKNRRNEIERKKNMRRINEGIKTHRNKERKI